MSDQQDSPIALTDRVAPTKQPCHAKVYSSGPKVRFIPSPEFLAEFVEWRQSRMETLPSKCAFDRWYEALSKEHIWHQWMLHGLVKSMDIPTRNTLAHLYVNAKSPQTEKRVGSAKRGLLVLHSNARNHHHDFRYCIFFVWIDYFSPLQLRGRRPTRRSSSAREVS